MYNIDTDELVDQVRPNRARTGHVSTWLGRNIKFCKTDNWTPGAKGLTDWEQGPERVNLEHGVLVLTGMVYISKGHYKYSQGNWGGNCYRPGPVRKS